ncbi:MAG: sulfatase-like hydrolase/transferase [Nitrosopumilus sp.]|nr:sulfatase-like hydrolase/transferase [Nitrosopumilus sp.]
MPDPPSIMFVVVDSLRADRLHGANKTPSVPALDGLAAGGTLFATSISPAASTLESVGSMLTGLFPPRSGMSSPSYEKVGRGVENYVALLRRRGYSTHITQSSIAEMIGIPEEFEHRVDSVKRNNYLSLHDGLGGRLLDAVREMERDPPWFFYIHLNDLHSPISVPGRFQGDEYGGTSYDRMISVIDHWLGRIIDIVDLDRTLIAVTSDHGEYVRSVARDGIRINLEGGRVEKSLWKASSFVPEALYPAVHRTSAAMNAARSRMRAAKARGAGLSPSEERTLVATRSSPGHHMFDDTLVTPLLLRGPGVAAGRIVGQQVRNVDIFPTIMELCGLDGIPGVDGRSLLPLMRGDAVEEDPAYIESMPAIRESKKVAGIRTSGFKYLRDADGGGERVLYDLSSDPGEERNVAGENPGAVDRLEGILSGILAGGAAGGGTDEERKKVEDELRKMGYV